MKKLEIIKAFLTNGFDLSQAGMISVDEGESGSDFFSDLADDTEIEPGLYLWLWFADEEEKEIHERLFYCYSENSFADLEFPVTDGSFYCLWKIED